MEKIIDIYSGGKYPANALSNFCKHPFIFRGFSINSMEGFLQALTHKNPVEQVKIFLMHGVEAKRQGLPWDHNQTLYWMGSPIMRYSQEYQDLLDEAYQALYDGNEKFRKALNDTGNAQLIHSIGSKASSHTILTEKEFVTRLTRLRNTGKSKEKISMEVELF